MLNKAGVVGVPQLVHEQLVQIEHPVTRQPVANSTHILCTLQVLSRAGHINAPPYQLRVLACLVTRPRGYPIFKFFSLTELLVGFMDCITGKFFFSNLT